MHMKGRINRFAIGLIIFMAFASHSAVAGAEIDWTLLEQIDLSAQPLDIAVTMDGSLMFILTPGEKFMKGAIEKAAELEKEKGYFRPNQFTNPANAEAHRKTTAKEILKQVPDLDVFIGGIGTGGTVTGIGEVLKKEIKNKQILIIAVEPASSPVLSGGEPGVHKIQGIGAGFVPEILNRKIIDEIIKVENEDAYTTARDLASKEGIFAGISSGAAVWAALKVAKNLSKEKKVLVILPDTGERYLSTDLFEL